MPNFEKYLEHLERNGPDMILETAAQDHRVTDDEYTKLYEAATKDLKRGKRGGIGPLARLKDREAARKVLGQ